MSTKFDLTTESGRKEAAETFDKYGWAIGLPLWLAKKTWDWFSTANEETIKNQKETAIELIKAGRDNNLESMTIKLDQNVGLDFGSSFKEFPVKCKIGKDGQMVVEVKYRNS